MGCCSCEDHDYCCRCPDSEAERVHSVVEDILDGTYDGEADLPSFPPMSSEDAHQATSAIIAVLKHEHIV